MVGLNSQKKRRKTHHGYFIEVVAVLFAVSVFAYVFAGLIALPVLYVYGVMSIITFILYWLDKQAAEQGAWRVSERTLHLTALFCGWPGACAAQRIFRHKTVKAPFQLVFAACVFLNIGGLVLYTSSAASGALFRLASQA